MLEIVDKLISDSCVDRLKRNLFETFDQLNSLIKGVKMPLLSNSPYSLIFGIASILVLVLLIKLYQKPKIKKKTNQAARVKESQPPSSIKNIFSPIGTSGDLCLVVSAYTVSNLKKGDSVDASNVEKLIDNASYFLCTTIQDANSKERFIETTDEVISSDSNREVYIRIHIPDGQEMIDKKATYFLKKNLPSHGQGVVKQLAYLKNLSGLEKFNRI